MSSNIEIKRICKYCNRIFAAHTTVTRYCSHRCNSRDYKTQQKKNKIRRSNRTSRKAILNFGKDAGIKRVYYTIVELSIVTNVSQRTLFRLTKDKNFPKLRIGRRLLFNREKVVSYFEDTYGR